MGKITLYLTAFLMATSLLYSSDYQDNEADNQKTVEHLQDESDPVFQGQPAELIKTVKAFSKKTDIPPEYIIRKMKTQPTYNDYTVWMFKESHHWMGEIKEHLPYKTEVSVSLMPEETDSCFFMTGSAVPISFREDTAPYFYVKVQCYFISNSSIYGTGLLIDQQTVLTTMTNITMNLEAPYSVGCFYYDPQTKDFRKKARVESLIFPSQYMKFTSEDLPSDFVLLRLAQPVEHAIPCVSFASISDKNPEDTYHLYGFNGYYRTLNLYSFTQKEGALQNDNSVLTYETNVKPGSGGASVLLKKRIVIIPLPFIVER